MRHKKILKYCDINAEVLAAMQITTIYFFKRNQFLYPKFQLIPASCFWFIFKILFSLQSVLLHIQLTATLEVKYFKLS